jgi:hypothetical protein
MAAAAVASTAVEWWTRWTRTLLEIAFFPDKLPPLLGVYRETTRWYY